MMKRCEWAESDDLMRAYHDTEWGVPLHDEGKLFEFLVLDGAQAGLSWSTILRKRAGYRRAFSEFDARKIASYSETDVSRLLADPSIVRNRRKIERQLRTQRHSSAFKRPSGPRQLHLAVRRRQPGAEPLGGPRRDTRQHGGVASHEQRPPEKGFRLCRAHGLLCLHAGGRHGE